MASQQPPIPAQTPQNQPPQQPQQQGAGERPLNVRDALSYLDQVKVSCQETVRDTRRRAVSGSLGGGGDW